MLLQVFYFKINRMLTSNILKYSLTQQFPEIWANVLVCLSGSQSTHLEARMNDLHSKNWLPELVFKLIF